jgi:parvulin-like peptidyl-prolyl isomerase
MYRHLITAAFTAALAMTASAQQSPAVAPQPAAGAVESAAAAAPQAAAADPAKIVVATVNGQPISRERLDLLWNSIPEEIRAQYTTNAGGKRGFLDNYIRKRLVVQEAVQLGFAKGAVPAEIDPEKEAALFDLYVREVVAPQIITEAEMRKFYDENTKEFAHPDRAKVRMIHISSEERAPQEAQAKITGLLKNLFTIKMTGGPNAAEMLATAFEAAAREHSDHPSASSGGDLGWVTRDTLEPRLSDAVFTMQPQTMSGIVRGKDGFYLLMLEERQNASNATYDNARPAIREYLLSMNAQKVIAALNAETVKLLAAGKVEVFADNVE